MATTRNAGTEAPQGLLREAAVIAANSAGGAAFPWLDAPLQQALAMGATHALLAHGPAGVGHLAFGLRLAQAWLCEASVGSKPCTRCASCQRVCQRTHPDLLVMLPFAIRRQLGWASDDEEDAPKGDAKPSNELRIMQVRQAIAWSHNSSGRGHGKVLLIHPADALNAQSANALLKTLEEPPGALRIVLTSTDPDKLLPTVRSRCQRLRLDLPPPDQASAWLQSQGLVEPDALLRLAGGSPLQALDWAAEGLTPAVLADLPRRVTAGDATALAGWPIPRVLDLLQRLAHDLMAQAVGGAPRYFAVASLPAAARPAAVSDWQRALLRTARHADHPWSAALLVEALVTQARAIWVPASGSSGSGPTRSAAGGVAGSGAPIHLAP